MTSPLADLDALLALPRVAGLALSPDGRRLVTSVGTLSPDATRRTTALWEVDPAGERPARQLTRSRTGESAPVFAPDGTVLFTSARPDPAGKEADDEDRTAAVWRLPEHGEAQVVGARPGGVRSVVVARDSGTVVALSDTLSGDDEARRTDRRERRVGAVLHDGYPVRHWDADLGPGRLHLLVAEPGEQLAWRDLTPTPGRALDRADLDVSPDGGTVVTPWWVPEPGGSERSVLVAVDVATGQRRTLDDDGSSEAAEPRVSPDGSWVAYLRTTRSTTTEPVDTHLLVVPLDGSSPPRRLAPDWDRWPGEPRWLPGGSALLVTADDEGARPVFRVALTGDVVRLTGDRGHYTDVVVARDGTCAYALRDAVDGPPAPVRLDLAAPDQTPRRLQGPAPEVALPGTLTEVHTTAADGTALRAWLVLPEGEGPHPLLLWAHGGPLGSWNGWSWRWQPWRLAALGYAVLLPDPALSTGYGLAMVRRGWGRWGGAPYEDVMAVTDAALERADLDADRTGMMGGSYGGYLANWVAGHTGRFRAVVSHAGLWDLPQFSGTTDVAYYWLREMSPEMVAAHNPRAHLDAITSPVLVVHGDRDHRVPVGEGLRLWWDLCSRATGPSPHRFLLFPDEGHWVEAPQNAKTWYQTVEAFLAWHVLGKEWAPPEVLA